MSSPEYLDDLGAPSYFDEGYGYETPEEAPKPAPKPAVTQTPTLRLVPNASELPPAQAPVVRIVSSPEARAAVASLPVEIMPRDQVPAGVFVPSSSSKVGGPSLPSFDYAWGELSTPISAGSTGLVTAGFALAGGVLGLLIDPFLHKRMGVSGYGPILGATFGTVAASIVVGQPYRSARPLLATGAMVGAGALAMAPLALALYKGKPLKGTAAGMVVAGTAVAVLLGFHGPLRRFFT